MQPFTLSVSIICWFSVPKTGFHLPGSVMWLVVCALYPANALDTTRWGRHVSAFFFCKYKGLLPCQSHSEREVWAWIWNVFFPLKLWSCRLPPATYLSAKLCLCHSYPLKRREGKCLITTYNRTYRCDTCQAKQSFGYWSFENDVLFCFVF